ncbi:MAG: response regulator [Patescibacteria group bacterium]
MAHARVVITEDDPDLLEALVREFRAQDFEVFTARNGVEGVSRVLQVRPNVIVLDLLMPEMNGHEMMRELTTHHHWIRNVPVLIMTNYAAGEEQSQEWMKKVPVAYMLKADAGLAAIVEAAKELLLRVEKEVY